MKHSNLVIEKVAQCWCDPRVSDREMDVTLAEVFCDLLENVWSKPWLGNATTGELIEELKARSNLLYKTVDGENLAKSPESVGASCI